MPTKTMSPRRKLRVSLWMAMVMIVLLAIPLARLAVRARAQKEAVRAISKAGGFVGYDWQFLPDGRRNPSPKPPGQSWFLKWLGPDYVQTAVQVTLQRDDNGDDVMEHVGRLDGLRTINITGTEITDSGIEDLKALQRLGLGKTRLTDTGLARLRGLDKMQTLGLYGTPSITGAGLANLAGMTQMTTLNLSGTSITDEGLVHLRAMGSLEVLNLAGIESEGQDSSTWPESRP